MWQSILTIIIIILAGFLAIRPYLKKKSAASPDCNCGSSCAGCPVMEMKTEKKRT